MSSQQYFLAAGGQDNGKSGLINCTRIGKNCAIPSLHRDSYMARLPASTSPPAGGLPDAASGNAYYPYQRAVSGNNQHITGNLNKDYFLYHRLQITTANSKNVI
jgi:hypothetical protein